MSLLSSSLALIARTFNSREPANDLESVMEGLIPVSSGFLKRRLQIYDLIFDLELMDRLDCDDSAS